MSKRIYEKKKISGLSYAFTDDGIELPVIDITHPLFNSSIDIDTLNSLSKEAAKNAAKIKKFPNVLKRLIAKLSKKSYLSGMRTLMIKLGPGLIGTGRKRFLAGIASRTFNAMAIRMRLRDICISQTNALIPLLRNSPTKNLCFINIAGGAASDSINTLVLIQKEEPSLLGNRKIEINVLDTDTFGPNFANQCITALKEPKGRFYGLDISFRHIRYNWNNTDKLVDLLSERKEWINMCVSEGGLFEYASDDEIVQNVNMIYKNSMVETKIAGSLILDINKVNPAIPAMAEITGIKARFLGIDGLNIILNRTKWKLDSVVEDNPTYVIFTLKK